MQCLCLDVAVRISAGLSQARNRNGQFVVSVLWGIAVQKVAFISLPYKCIIHYRPDIKTLSYKKNN
jgi:hypothetical protein